MGLSIRIKKKAEEWEDNIMNRMMHWSYTVEQKNQVQRAMANKLPKSLILSFFYPETSAGIWKRLSASILRTDRNGEVVIADRVRESLT